MASNIASFFQSYSVTGIPAIDALILAQLIPLIISSGTNLLETIKRFIFEILIAQLMIFYHRVKNKFLGTVEVRLNVSQDQDIYPIIRNMFFSPAVKSDNIDTKTLGILKLITDSKTMEHPYSYYDNAYEINDLCVNETNDIIIKKRISAESVTKQYFEFDNYYIVVSENKKIDYNYLFRKNKHNDNGQTNESKTEYFILFEAIRCPGNNTKNENIIKNFLYDRFKINIRVPYKYIIKVSGLSLINKFIRNSNFVKDNMSSELKISDGISKFLSNPNVKDFYHFNIRDTINISPNAGLPSMLFSEFTGNSLTKENILKDLHIKDISKYDISNIPNILSPNARSFLNYFFSNTFQSSNIRIFFFYFRDNKIVIFLSDDKSISDSCYICIVSINEKIVRQDIYDIFTELITENDANKNSVEKSISVYRMKHGDWQKTNCESRSYDTIYLPTNVKHEIKREMTKFICLEKIFRKNEIPYKKGFLFHGPPGTGKTSLVKTIAYTYNIPIYTFDINDESIHDENITDIINSISGSGNRILLFEDIDSAFSDKEQLKYQTKIQEQSIPINSNDISSEKTLENKILNTKFLTYSGLLNALDGVMTGHDGTIIIMTTNYIEKLGPALIRPGRIDLVIELTYCDRDQIIDMSENFIQKSYQIIQNELSDSTSKYQNMVFNNSYSKKQLRKLIEQFADNLLNNKTLSTVKPCELQAYLLKYIENVDDIFSKYQELIK